jgi:ureidoglycolate lyase
MARLLQPRPLTPAAFATFGTVIEARTDTALEINQGFTTRFHALAEVAAGPNGRAMLSIFRGRPRPVEISRLERHPLSSQAFVPLGGRRWLVVVADTPRAEACHAFLARGDQGVQYHPGVWHHPLLVLEAAQDFLVVDRAGPGDNLEEVQLSAPLELRLG